ncbi:hypothetical protein [uncultured Mobiluncus sp.]|uniref:hypothetical protein n=1 Tax=uncultured Mobiluncus sp. TaxID=293425 RepID=UPI002635AC0F|nr:hypothetical protein [uncultured Mobiluncus sp.]
MTQWTSHIITDPYRGCKEEPRFQVLTRRVKRVVTAGKGTVKNSVQKSGKCHFPQKSTPKTGVITAGQGTFDDARSNITMGSPYYDRDHAIAAAGASGSVVAFGSLPTIKAMSTGRSSFIIGFDTESTQIGESRVIDAYQFATIDPFDSAFMVEIVILPLTGHRLSLVTALWEVICVARIYAAPGVHTDLTAKGVSRALFWCDDEKDRWDALAKYAPRITLASHFGQADLTAFRCRPEDKDIMVHLVSAAGGLVSLFPIRFRRSSDNWAFWKPISVTVRDTMALAAGGKKSLKALGDSCGVPKLEVPGDYIAHMSDYRERYLTDFLEYAINDAVICVEYISRVFGENTLPPISLSGGGASAVVASGISYWGCMKPKFFRRLYSGLVPIDDDVDFEETDDGLAFYVKRRWKPVDGAASTVIHAWAQSYHGGLNACPMPGYWPEPTVDVDAQNAYPTGMSLIEDLDWEPDSDDSPDDTDDDVYRSGGVIDEVVHDRALTLDDIPTPLTPFVGFVSFSFPKSVAFPCLPVLTDATLIYPRTSKGVSGEWVAGPELWLALRLGATVHCQIGYKCRLRRGPEADGKSRMFRNAFKGMIADRATAKALYGKKSLEELVIKDASNGSYGKAAQNVTSHNAWQAYEQVMDEVGGSAITSPYHAAMTTSLVRMQLLAVMNQISNAGGKIFSVTTDGFITDFPIDEVTKLDLFGFVDYLHECRSALVNDPSIWEAKHHQDDLVNFTTRGNVSLKPGGVCAHNGLRVPDGIEEDSDDDRMYLLKSVVTREGKVSYSYTGFPSFKDLSRIDDRKDFIHRPLSRSISMDFDLKRKPKFDTMEARFVSIDGQPYEMATFDTEAWETVGEAQLARDIARSIAAGGGCLRTVSQWEAFRLRLTYGKSLRVTTPERKILLSILASHRRGVVSIPTLADKGLTVQEKLGWLSTFGLGNVSRSDWDNARRPERATQILPRKELEPYLTEMMKA